MLEKTAIVVFLGAVLQGLSGFGFGLVTMPLLGLFLPIRIAVPLVAVQGLVIVALMGWRLRAVAERSQWFPLVAGGVLATPVGVYALSVANEHLLKTCLGLFVLVYSLASLATRIPTWKLSDRHGYLAGAVGGMLGGAFNTGGPPIIVYVTLRGWKKDEIRSALQVFFFTVSAWKLLLFWRAGLFTASVTEVALLTLPIAVGGTLFGDHVSKRFEERKFQKWILLLLGLVGITLLVQ